MKFILLVFVYVSTAWAAQAHVPFAITPPEVAVQWETTEHDFGTVQHQVPQSAEFTFTNHSSEAVFITKAAGSCGCTVAEYTEEAIAPGDQGIVRATYNATQLGAFNKTVSVTLSDGATQVLHLQGTVVEQDNG